MPYIEDRCKAGNTLEILRHHSHKYPNLKGELRDKKIKITSLAQEKINLRNAETNLRRLMNANFVDGDFLVRLDFQKYPNILPERMQVLFSKFLRDMRRKSKNPFRYIYTKEIGPRGSRHVHMICSKEDMELFTSLWQYGGIHIDPLVSGGQYAKIASYFLKYAEKTEGTLGIKLGKKYQSSRNLFHPLVEKKIISAGTFRKTPKDLKDYLLEKDSFAQGINAEGYEYCFASYIKDTDGRENIFADGYKERVKEKGIRDLHFRSKRKRKKRYSHQRSRPRSKRKE